MGFKRQIAVGDIHGCYGLTVDLVENVIKFDPLHDQLIFIGDYIDRGTDSAQVVQYVSDLKNKYEDHIVLLAGNHEYLAYHAFKYRTAEMFQLWIVNGGVTTIASYDGIENAMKYENSEKILVPFVESLEFYYETKTHIFLHGGVPTGETIQTAAKNALLWERNYDRYRGKDIIVGHTPHKNVTKYTNAVVIDTGAVFYGKLSAYDPVNDKIYETINSNPKPKAGKY
ncbi:MAG: metallophosphoesterase [Candidatus Magnetominusculus sp. LBB02]|nr:metallophosphoesterase [Candidatus Magnetominusculus sp. LBB02]